MDVSQTPGWTYLSGLDAGKLAAPREGLGKEGPGKDAPAHGDAHGKGTHAARAIPELKVMAGLERVRVVRISFDPGDEMREHSAPAPILVMGQLGSVAFTVGEGEDTETFELSPGSAVHVPARVPHSLRADGAATVSLLLLTD